MPLSEDVPIALWDGAAPGSEFWTHHEWTGISALHGLGIVRNVVAPSITPYIPDAANDHAVIVCPGGAMHFLAIEQGRSVARLLKDAGFPAFLLKYRVSPTPEEEEEFVQVVAHAYRSGLERSTASITPLAVSDARRALTLVRAEGYRHVTLLGFSAGGRVAAELALHGSDDLRPDATAVFYLSEISIPEGASDLKPLFLLAASDDELGIDGILSLHTVWRKEGAPVELHLFAEGGHGFGTVPTGRPVDAWPGLLLAWLTSLTSSASITSLAT